MRRAAQFKHELVAPTPSHPQVWGVQNIFPQPFEWDYIPSGTVTINGESISVDIFNIAKYPITNARSKYSSRPKMVIMILNGGIFLLMRVIGPSENSTSQPRAFPQNDHPRANVNRYEAIAFCNWLTDRFNAHAPELPPILITLPTEQQWQRAALGDGLRIFPWGNEFDISRCNTKESEIERTTPVTQFTSGASPFNVMDAFGNVSEWCLNKENSSGADTASILGGSWKASINESYVRAPSVRQDNTIGFRIVNIIPKQPM